ncbi:MAG: hypothetical protein NVS9B3_00110 [Gemmatimonadaceae bacterium]
MGRVPWHDMRTAVVLAAVTASGCGHRVTGPSVTDIPRDSVPLATTSLDDGVGQLRTNSGIQERTRLVIRDQPSWTAFWARAAGRVSPTPPPLAVDFSREMVIVAAMGSRPTGGYSIGIDGVYDGGARLYVAVRETSPGASCFTTQALTAPLTMRRMPAARLEVVFIERTAQTAC